MSRESGDIDPIKSATPPTVMARYRHEFSQMLGTSDLGPSDKDRRAAARDSEWMRLLYEQHRALIYGDMDRSWSILQIFVPVSIAPFAALAAFSEFRRVELMALATASCLTLLSANLMVDRIKQHERRTWEVVRAIEAEVGLGGLGDGWNLAGGELKGVRFRYVRWSLLVMVAAAWILILCAA